MREWFDIGLGLGGGMVFGLGLRFVDKGIGR